MNIVLIMAGGVGKRFGANLPKQYMMLNGRPVIDYVIDAVNDSKLTDEVIVFADKEYRQLSKLLMSCKNYHFVDVGKDRYGSLKNGFDYIDKHFKKCKNIVIVDAAAPFLFSELIDDYFTKLSDYDAVITAQKITGALGNYNWDPLDREDYYMTQSPEGFNYKLISKYLNPNAKTQELAWHLPVTTKKYLNFNFKNNLKLTYNFELEYASCLKKYLEQTEENSFSNVKDKSFFSSRGLEDYLMRLYPNETNQFLDNVYMYYKELINRYGDIKKITINQQARYGIVFSISINDTEEVVVKIVPKFIERFESEKDAYSVLSNSFMCPLLDVDINNNAIFLKKLNIAKTATYEDNIKLTDFFNRVFENSNIYDNKKMNSKHLTNFYKELEKKVNTVEKCKFHSSTIKKHLENSIKYYDRYFIGKGNYVIHGDLRANNILLDNENYFAIDPIGYIAPITFETSRFIIDDIETNMLFDINDRLDLLLNYFSKWFNKSEILYSLYIFLIFIIYNSTFEYSTDEKTTFYLNLINIISARLGDE